MECSFRYFSNSISCSTNTNIRPNSELLLLYSCNDNIDPHISTNRINPSSVSNEQQLIKFRSGLFEQNADNFTICPNHRYYLGKGWKKSKFCMLKPPLKHCNGTRKAEKATISVQQSREILTKFGIFIPVGAGVCRKCRSELVESIRVDDLSLTTAVASDEASEYTLSQASCGSIWTPGASQDTDKKEIAAGHRSSEDWGTQRQILSLVANTITYSKLKSLIPNLSRFKFTAARKHALSKGQGQQVPNEERRREGITNAQISHFLDFVTSPAIITDMPYGDSKFKLSNGETITVPKIILNSVRTRVVEQYFGYCDETNYENKASISSYMRILHSVGPNVRKSMKGLDNYASDGAKAIESLLKTSELFCRLGKGKEWHDNTCRILSASKQYLKLEYKLHIKKDSDVADHCCRFSLSDGTHDFSDNCDHCHSATCKACEELERTLENLLDIAKAIQYDNEDQKDDTLYIVTESVRAVREWKKHVLRTVNQDMARHNILQTLNDEEVLIERDWAMKFLPMLYRECQSCWFGKRGLNWHITVATYRSGEILTTHTFIHIFDSATQDAETSNAVLSNSMEFLHKIKPSTKFAYIRSDNAGCFHGSVSVCAIPFLSSNIQCLQMDFADPQGGKSICDRKAAHTKSFIRRHVNEGNDVCTASDFKEAIMKSKMKNFTAIVALPPSDRKKESAIFKIPKITSVNNFVYTGKDQVRIWRQYGIGKGRLVPASGSMDDLPQLTVLDSYTTSEADVGVAQTETSNQHSDVNIDVDVVRNQQTEEEQFDGSTLDDDITSDVCEEGLQVDQMSMLFSCNECTKTFQKYGNLLRHLDTGSHTVKSMYQTLSDKAKIEYSKQMEKVNLLSASSENVTPGRNVNLLKQGWALKSRGEVKRFTDDQRTFLDEKFQKGEKTGQKYDPEEVSQEMRQIRTVEGKKRFSPEEFLSAQQIGSYFSRLVLQKRKKNNNSYTDEDLQAEIAEAEFNALNEVSS
ncbi:hypothetical protein FSP39_012971 [Pinctada imbricata]|uniref:C2H2-type domain-containing protein n=1 Tax=Pinctada imbricata TaxID=66713 RepID=A0AA89C5T7_PINIB|nr:hypothetical protein FSP39_012971 [Pinctada imbricata]